MGKKVDKLWWRRKAVNKLKVIHTMGKMGFGFVIHNPHAYLSSVEDMLEFIEEIEKKAYNSTLSGE